MYLREGLTDLDRLYRSNKRGKKGCDCIQRDYYKFYIKNKNYNKTLPVELATKLFVEYNRRKIKDLIFFGEDFVIPMGLGILSITRRKRPKMEVGENGKIKNKKFYYVVDYNKTKKAKEKDPNAKVV
jgi:hypothetical protein